MVVAGKSQISSKASPPTPSDQITNERHRGEKLVGNLNRKAEMEKLASIQGD